ncbi:MAG: 50S ribosomal protein L11 methyltransferase [Gemmatimonadaceae bacterium]
MSWLAVSVRGGGGEDRAAVLGVLFASGSRAVEEVGDDLHTYLPAGTDPGPLVRAVTAASPAARVETSEVVVADWDAGWRHGLTARRAGPLTVAPPWLAYELDPASSVIVDPGMAFGTGDHATTRGVLRLMAAVIRPGDRVADVGAGSGVLSIAAAKLGASRVAAIELDPDAIDNAEANVQANSVGDRVTVLLGDAAILLSLVAPIRVVLANIVAPTLLELLPVMDDALTSDGRSIVSGVLEEQREEFVRALRDAGWIVEAEDREESWWSAVIARR